MIVETEAYSQEEEACHGYNKKTPSNKVLFGEPGRFYIYRSYGIHHCLNIVTDKDNFASGVLIRAVFISNKNERSASGPGLVTKTFEVDHKFNSLEILNNKYLWISKGNSYLLKELEEGEKLCTSAESLLAASSKLLRVLVLASKNIDVINFPCKAGIFFVPALLRDLNLSVNSKTDL